MAVAACLHAAMDAEDGHSSGEHRLREILQRARDDLMPSARHLLGPLDRVDADHAER